MSDSKSASEDDDRGIYAGRIEVLYALGRHYLSLPFAALCVFAKLLGSGNEGILPFLPLVLLIVVAIAAAQLTQAYKRQAPSVVGSKFATSPISAPYANFETKTTLASICWLVSRRFRNSNEADIRCNEFRNRDTSDDPHFWARRYMFVSAIAGASWGIGVFFWFVPDSFPAQAYLCLAFMGMTTTEFIARSAHRPAYLAHAAFSLGPLILMLLIHGGMYSTMSAVLMLCFTAALVGFANGMARLLDESIRLKIDNAALQRNLHAEKQQAEAARDAAQSSASAKSAFIANISHELRTPLNALLGMAQLLDQADLGSPHRNYVKVMLEAGRGLQTLLDDVIALTQDDNDRLMDVECDPVQAARAVARLLQPLSWEKRLRLTVTTGANLPRVAADPRRVRQALLKLADNGLKFTDVGGVEIHVDAYSNNGAEFVRFAVVDTGHGVPPEIAPTLFGAFSPGETAYARRVQGAGLGLAVVKRIVDAAGGETGFESEPGQGATFWFGLPAATYVATAPAADENDTTPSPSDLSLLVFVEDREAHRQLARALEPFGNSLVLARTAAEAIARAGREHFDVIIVGAENVDMLAAAPGVKAPILALLSRGERAPVCANEIIRWPALPREIYHALASISAKAAISASPPAEEIIAAIELAGICTVGKIGWCFDVG